MNSRKLPCLPIILLLSLPFLQFPVSSSNPDEYLYNNCDGSFSCGSITGIDYPFRGNGKPDYCGYPGLVLSCQNNTTTIDIMKLQYRVLQFHKATRTLRIAREDVIKGSCPRDLVDTTLDDALFGYASSYMNVTFLYGCQNAYNLSSPISSCNASGFDNVYLLPGTIDPLPPGCQASVTVPVAGIVASVNSAVLQNAVQEGFDVTWKVDDKACSECTGSGGRCGYNFYRNQTACYCSHEPYVGATCSASDGGSSSAKPGGGPNNNMKILLPILGAIVAGVGLGWAIFYLKQRRKRKAEMAAQSSIVAKSKDIPSPPLTQPLTSASTNYSRSTPSYVSSRTEFGMASTYFGVQVFSYDELEEATNNFDPSMELGDGGFGTVYYGKLQDGRVVAVKRLYENNFKRVEQFMNEVEILTKLRHDNLVTLYGCTSKRSRELLLVYEYIPNGTVADHLHGKRSKSGLLSWPIRLNIAIETADALAYLHRSTIIHRDVKTTNILLDNDFRVKVADFGLSRLFPNDVTHVSTAPQGTPGYVDPEYYQCYQLTEKSDVYSFGVVLVELISSKMAVDTNRERHDINLANMAINKIQNHSLNELVDPGLGFETNPLVRRMTTVVAELAFRCLQTERDMRPSMDEVVNALRRIKEGDSPNGEKAEVVDIIVEDDSGPLKGHPPPMSPDSNVTDKNISSSSGLNSFS